MLQRLSNVNYKLELPQYLRMHNVFHSSVLKLYYEPSPGVDVLPRARVMPWDCFLKISAIFHNRWNSLLRTDEFFVHFEDTHPSQDTWITQEELNRFGLLDSQETWTSLS